MVLDVAEPVFGAFRIEVDGADEDGGRSTPEGGQMASTTRVVVAVASTHQRLPTHVAEMHAP